jgi:hypothetical protein
LREGDDVDVRIGPDTHRIPWRRTFGGAAGGILVVDGSGMMALSVPGERADRRYRIDTGTSVVFTRPTAAG